MSDDEIMKALDDEINSCIENHYKEALTANLCLRNMILRLQKENAELRECLEKLAKKLRCPTEDGKPKKGIWCGNCREICDADGTNLCDRNVYFTIIEAALEGGK